MFPMTRPNLADLFDGALELTVVGSFSRLGPMLRRHLYDWQIAPDVALSGRTAVVTGPTSGLGFQAARSLATLGARVVLLGRSEARLAAVRNQLMASTGADRYVVVIADMSSISSVRHAVEHILATEKRLDVLVDNAGAIYPERRETPEGIEQTLAVLVCGPFALTSGLMPLLSESGGQVVAVTSGGMYAQAVQLDDLQWRTRPYDGTRAYAQAKRVQVALIREWARRCVDSGVSFNAMHPGWADTPGLAEALPGFYRLMWPLLRSAREGSDTIAWLATTPELPVTGGRLYLDRRPRPFDRLPQTRLSRRDRAELWTTISALVDAAPKVVRP
jgi:NAD(P)-dependent dehydrogenase (short-subunit alcohol dehydrogenase family)